MTTKSEEHYWYSITDSTEYEQLEKALQEELRLRNGITSKLSEDVRFIQLTEQFIKMASPDYILKRGYSLALKDGKIIKHASDLRAGEELTTRFIDGEIKSIIKP